VKVCLQKNSATITISELAKQKTILMTQKTTLSLAISCKIKTKVQEAKVSIDP
jgi:hypothetical protein